MKVWILQTGEPVHIDKHSLRPMRAMNLSNMLAELGHEVVLWTSNFDHFSKKHRSTGQVDYKISEQISIKLIPSRGYKSNMGLSRLIDHAQLAINLRKQLRNQTPPDIAFIGYPPIETAWILSIWMKKKKIPFVVDVKDAWPEILVRAVPSKLKFLGQFLILPYKFMMKKIFKNARGLIAPSSTFLDWSLKQAQRKITNFDIVVPLTTPSKQFTDIEISEAGDWLDRLDIKDDMTIRISFIGSLNSAFYFDPIIFAAKQLNYQFVIAGDGPMYDEIKTQSAGIKNIVMPGWLSQCQSQVLSKRSKVMLAPLRDLADFKMSIPNKFYDYMSSGKPIVSSISGIAGKLISENKIGLEYVNQEITSLLVTLEKILMNPKLLEDMSIASRELYQKRFSYEMVYQNLVDHLVMVKNDN